MKYLTAQILKLLMITKKICIFVTVQVPRQKPNKHILNSSKTTFIQEFIPGFHRTPLHSISVNFQECPQCLLVRSHNVSRLWRIDQDSWSPLSLIPLCTVKSIFGFSLLSTLVMTVALIWKSTVVLPPII